MNKYEMVLISAREARRLCDVARVLGRELNVRPTILAWERLSGDKIQHTYEPERFEAAAEAEVEEGA